VRNEKYKSDRKWEVLGNALNENNGESERDEREGVRARQKNK
jgi:hypothetical protein